MSIVVQKFGGTSVRDEQGRRHAYEHIKEALSEKKKWSSSYQRWGEKEIRTQQIR